jgi:hypothetical protein
MKNEEKLPKACSILIPTPFSVKFVVNPQTYGQGNPNGFEGSHRASESIEIVQPPMRDITRPLPILLRNGIGGRLGFNAMA